MKNELLSSKIDVVGNHRCVPGEGPVWNEGNNMIYWLDIVRGEIHEFSADSQTERAIPVQQMVGSIALCANGDFIGGLEFICHSQHRIQRDDCKPV